MSFHNSLATPTVSGYESSAVLGDELTAGTYYRLEKLGRNSDKTAKSKFRVGGSYLATDFIDEGHRAVVDSATGEVFFVDDSDIFSTFG